MGLRVRDSGYGLTVTGTSTSTVAQGNVFNRNATGVRLLSATGMLISGSVAGQGNTISNATCEGVFAHGFCTNSRVVRNTITGTAVPYNTTQSRNLTVVP
jgi:nitrous oxidase accessory protein NosD